MKLILFSAACLIAVAAIYGNVALTLWEHRNVVFLGLML